MAKRTAFWGSTVATSIASSIVAAGSAAAAVMAMHFGSLALIAMIILISMASGMAAHYITRRVSVKQAEIVVKDALDVHIKQMHIQREETLKEAAELRIGRD